MTDQIVTPKFNKTDLGCWLDSAYGFEHLMYGLAAIACDVTPDYPSTIATNWPTKELHDCAEVLMSGDADELSDDHSEFDIVTDYINQFCDEGISFQWIDGDLVLTSDEEYAS